MIMKRVKPSISLHRGALIFFTLVLVSGISVALVLVRHLAVSQFAYFHLPWNLFLAWLPLAFAFFAVRFQTTRWRCFVCASLWLLFIPNSPYLVTDLIHLRPRSPVPFWFDIVLVQSFVLTGLLLGFLSLYLMQQLVTHRYSWRHGWLFAFLVLGLTALGVYLGRFERWNSWDLFVNPIALFADIWDVIIRPRANRRAIVFSTLWYGFLVSTYLAFYALVALHRTTASNVTNPEGQTCILASGD
jgi:uncharacterized membrane protein